MGSVPFMRVSDRPKLLTVVWLQLEDQSLREHCRVIFIMAFIAPRTATCGEIDLNHLNMVRALELDPKE